MPIEKPTPGETEYRALVVALEQVEPACHDDERFTADGHDTTNAEEERMRRTCGSCPLLSECRSYASQAAPAAGFWAGRYWGRTSRTEAS